MSEPLEFKMEARALAHLLSIEATAAEPADQFLIERALNEAAAKALEWTETANRGQQVRPWPVTLRNMISALRTPSAPNAPKEAE